MEFRVYTEANFKSSPYWDRLPQEEQRVFNVLTQIFHFKANTYVLENLIDWNQVPEDPIYRMIFPRMEMLDRGDYWSIEDIMRSSIPLAYRKQQAQDIIDKLQPEYAYAPGNICYLGGIPQKGMTQIFPSIVSLYPDQMMKTCHSYCSYCFRWNGFKNDNARSNSTFDQAVIPALWIKQHPEVKDVLFSGADPLTLKTKELKRFIEPILECDTIDVIRINTKSFAYWPFRFTSDSDAEELLDLFRQIQDRGKHFNITAHFSHPNELKHPAVLEAVQRVKETGTTIRTHAPLIRKVNDSAETWSEMWTLQIKLGMIPYYMYMESGQNRQNCFRVPPAEALKIFQDAQKITTGLARTVRGPVFMYDINRVLLDGTTTVNGQKYFVLKSLQAAPGCDSEGDIKLVPYDENAMDLGNLYELFNESVTDSLGFVNLNGVESGELFFTHS
jgi:KamA family protein